ncbi:MAG: hypothetical protein HQL99_07330 [Magnetococcales bacterium]|nr:hypothetical protein [Magnetococcales bacterium]
MTSSPHGKAQTMMKVIFQVTGRLVPSGMEPVEASMAHALSGETTPSVVRP